MGCKNKNQVFSHGESKGIMESEIKESPFVSMPKSPIQSSRPSSMVVKKAHTVIPAHIVAEAISTLHGLDLRWSGPITPTERDYVEQYVLAKYPQYAGQVELENIDLSSLCINEVSSEAAIDDKKKSPRGNSRESSSPFFGSNHQDMAVVKLFGSFFSPYGYRVIWALKLKGIPYEYIDEDLRNKSPLLLQYNPIHKQVPVLVHDGKPICESTVILQYIDEIWPQNPLLPADPYDRAVALFWIKFADDKGYLMLKLYRANGEEQQATVKEWLEMLEVMEEHALVGVKKLFGGDEINMVDIAFSFVAIWLGVLEDILGLEICEPHKFPRVSSWIQNFKSIPVIKDNFPDTDKMSAFLKHGREMMLTSKPN